MTDMTDFFAGEDPGQLGEWDDVPATPADELTAFVLMMGVTIMDGPDGKPMIDTGDMTSDEIAELAELSPGFKEMLTKQVAGETKH
jgi:hypothetical protein